MDHTKQIPARYKQEQRSTPVTHVTAGFPTAEETVDVLLGMEAGCAGKGIVTASQENVLRADRPD